MTGSVMAGPRIQGQVAAGAAAGRHIVNAAVLITGGGSLGPLQLLTESSGARPRHNSPGRLKNYLSSTGTMLQLLLTAGCIVCPG